MKQWHNLVLVTAFGLILALPTIGTVCRVSKNKTINENRLLARFPRLRYDPDVWNVYFTRLENYYDDHFGFRESFIALGLTSKRALFPAALGPDVLRGRDGWLYLERDRDIDLMDDCLGMTKFSEGDLQDAQKKLEAQRDWLAARGIQYLLAIAPDKQSIYPEHLPDWLKPAATNRTDQFVAYMHLHSTVNVLDLRPVLRQARQQTDVYYMTDAHWNVAGAYVAAESIISCLSAQVPGLVPLGREAFTAQRLCQTGGELARLAGEPDLMESNRVFFVPGPNLPSLEFSAPETNRVDLPLMWSLPVPEIRTITTVNPRQARQVLMCGDSFAVDLQPFLGFHFGKVVCLRKAFEKSDVKEPRPQVMIDEVVERNLFYRK